MSVETRDLGIVVVLKDSSGDLLRARKRDDPSNAGEWFEFDGPSVVYATAQDLRDFSAGLVALANREEQ